MATLYRAGVLRPHKGRLFFCATPAAAAQWAHDLRRDIGDIVSYGVADDTPCVVNTHGYVESDWYLTSPDDRRRQVFRVSGTVGELSAILRMLDGDGAYVAHEIVIQEESYV